MTKTVDTTHFSSYVKSCLLFKPRWAKFHLTPPPFFVAAPVLMSASRQSFVISTKLGNITLRFRRDAAPSTCDYYERAIASGLFNEGRASFYRSDFVIQCGLHHSRTQNPAGDLRVNETNAPGTEMLGNLPGTAAVAHFDVPDCGNTEFFINLKNNVHLDSVYGGYCVFAAVDQSDKASWQVIGAIAETISRKQGGLVGISNMTLI